MSSNTYAVQYWSQSKQRFQAINEMPTPHLRNAEKKLAAVVSYYQEDTGGQVAHAQVQPQGNLEVLEALRAEILWRELNEPKPAPVEEARSEEYEA